MLGYLPVQKSARTAKMTSYCKNFEAWRAGDDQALSKLLAQGYDRLFLPKAERLARQLSHGHAERLLRSAWSSIANQEERSHLKSFSHFLSHFQDHLEQVAFAS